MAEFTPEHLDHLNGLTTRFSSMLRLKYINGNNEHGGKIWTKKHLIEMAQEEVVDLWVYLETLRQQIDQSGVELGSVED